MGTARTANLRGQGDRLREELVRAAVDLMAAPRSIETISLRAVARAVGVAPSAVYLHFGSVQALAEAMLVDLYADLRTRIDEADVVGQDPAARIRSIAHACAGWAQDRPGAYQVLFEGPDLPIAEGRSGPGLDLLDRVHILLIDSGCDAGEAAGLAARTWASVHGLISLRLHKPEAPWTDTLDHDLDALIEALLRGNGGRQA